EHVRARRREFGERVLPLVVRRQEPALGSRRNVEVRPASGIRDRRAEPIVRLGRGLSERGERGELLVRAHLAAEGAAAAEVLQGLQHELAARLVVRHREQRQLPDRVHPPSVEVRRLIYEGGLTEPRSATRPRSTILTRMTVTLSLPPCSLAISMSV